MILNVAWFVGLLICWDFPIQPIPGFTENDQREKISRLLQAHRNTIVTQNNHLLQARYAEEHLTSSRRPHLVLVLLATEVAVHACLPKLNNRRLENIA